MAKFISREFFKLVTDVDGEVIQYDVKPTNEEIERALKGETVIQKRADITIKYAIKNCLKKDFTERTPQGTIPDPHFDKKYEIYELLRKVNNIVECEETVELSSEEITIIKERAKRGFFVEVYGFLCDFLEQK